MRESLRPIKTGNLMVCNITTLVHTLFSGAASEGSEPTTVTVISVTGVCWRQKDNQRQQMQACRTDDTTAQSLLRANVQSNVVTVPLGLIIFPAHCQFLTNRELSWLFVLTWNVMSAWRGQRGRGDILTQMYWTQAVFYSPGDGWMKLMSMHIVPCH